MTPGASTDHDPGMTDLPPEDLAEPAANPGSRFAAWALWFLLLLVALGTQVALLALEVPQVLTGELVDVDSYVRMLRVKELLQGASWYDPVVERSNWPFGERSHWTRPVDGLLLGLTLTLRPFLGMDQALLVSAITFGPLVLIAVGVVLAWTVEPLTHRRHFAVLVLLTQPLVLSYSLPGRADHHGILLLLFIAVFGLAFRYLGLPGKGRAEAAAGIVAGVGVWVSPEFLLPLGVLFLLGATDWVFRGVAAQRANLRFSLALMASLVVAVFFEKPWTVYPNVEYDRLSLVHVAIAVIAVGFWWTLSLKAPARVGHRLFIAAIGGVLGLLILDSLFPGFRQGSWAGVDPELGQVYFGNISELAGIWPTGIAGAGRYLQLMGLPIAMAAYALVRVKRARAVGKRLSWGLIGVGLVLYAGLGTHQVRFAMFAQALATIPAAALWGGMLQRSSTRTASYRVAALQVCTAAAILIGPTVVGIVFVGLGTRTVPGESAAVCDFRSALGELATETTPRTIAAHMDRGPALLYHTPHRVLATPNHRNSGGILAVHGLMTETDMERARRLAAEREVDWILICPSYDEDFMEIDRLPESLSSRLAAGNPPDWLTLNRTFDSMGGFLLYEANVGVMRAR